MALFSLFLWYLLGQNPAAEIARIEKAAAGKPVRLLAPQASSYTNINAPAELFDAPAGKSILQLPRGLPVSILETRADGWMRVAVLSPFVMEAWAPPKGAIFIINANTLFYASPTDTEARGMLSQGLMVFPGKQTGEMTQVALHHHLSLRVWVPTARIGVKYESVQQVNFRYNSRWNRNVFECSPGPLYAARGSNVIVAELLDKAYFKKETESGDWIEIASASDYDIRFKAWVPAKRMGTQSQYYYQYQYSFRINQVLSESWLTGGFMLVRPTVGQPFPDNPSVRLYLRAGTPLSQISRDPNGLHRVVLGRRSYYYRPTLSFLLNALETETPEENPASAYYYGSPYDQQIRVWMPLSLMDVTLSSVQ